MSRTGGDWIDATVVAETMRLSRKAARARLDKAVEQGTLDKFFLYMGDDAPAPIVIEEAEIGTLIRLGDIGFIDEADTEIKLRRIKTEAVYCVRAAV